MEFEGVGRNVVTYNTLISAVGKAGEWQLAQQVVRGMKAEGAVQPDTVTYNAVMGAAGKASQVRRFVAWTHILYHQALAGAGRGR